MSANDKQRTLLIVDDDARLAQSLAEAFADEGFLSILAESRSTALEAVNNADVSLVILDRMLGREDGFDVIREIRLTDPILPIIMLTGRSGESDRVSGLELGADDYVVKPFSLPELIARVKAHLRKQNHIALQSPEQNLVLEFANITLDTASRQVQLRGVPVELSRQEFDLLLCFAENPNRALSREQLIARVWSDFTPFLARAVDSSVKRLREKLESEPTKEGLIGTVRGIGYRLNATVQRRSAN